MNELKELLANFKGEVYDLCFELLEKHGEDSDVFEFVCKTFTEPPASGSVLIDKHFTEEEIEEYESIYGATVNGLINSNIKKCNYGVIPKEDFYNTLWTVYCTVFQSLKEKAFAFYYTIIDASIPYQYLGKPISMSNLRYRELAEKNEQNIDKVKYIIKSKYNQRTERASLLLNCINEIDEYESKVVVLSQAITLFNMQKNEPPRSLDDLIRKIDERIDQLEDAETDKLESDDPA